jgi:plastocyanin
MKRSNSMLLVIVVLVVLILLGGGLYVLTKNRNANPTASNTSSSSSSSTEPMQMPNHNSNNSSSSNSTPQATDKVTVQNFAFSPASITVKAGTTVTWTNSDSVAHTVTETDGKSGPASSDVNPGSSYSFTFKDAGTYQYHCSIHPSMTGTVVVTG